MTDYLELLLARRENGEEVHEALKLDAADDGFPAKKRARAGQTAAQSGPGQGLGQAPVRRGAGAASSPLAEETPTPRLAAGWTESVPETERTGADGDMPPLLHPKQDVMPFARETLERPDREGAQYMRKLLTPPEELPGQGGEVNRPAGGAAALERRLTERSLSSAPAAARTVFAPEAEPATPAADWEEFDRRVERDARRYDGGMGLY